MFLCFVRIRQNLQQSLAIAAAASALTTLALPAWGQASNLPAPTPPETNANPNATVIILGGVEPLQIDNRPATRILNVQPQPPARPQPPNQPPHQPPGQPGPHQPGHQPGHQPPGHPDDHGPRRGTPAMDFLPPNAGPHIPPAIHRAEPSVDEQLRAAERLLDSPLIRRYLEMYKENAELRAQLELHERLARMNKQHGQNQAPDQRDVDARIEHLKERVANERNEILKRAEMEKQELKAHIELLQNKLNQLQAAQERTRRPRDRARPDRSGEHADREHADREHADREHAKREHSDHEHGDHEHEKGDHEQHEHAGHEHEKGEHKERDHGERDSEHRDHEPTPERHEREE